MKNEQNNTTDRTDLNDSEEKVESGYFATKMVEEIPAPGDARLFIKAIYLEDKERLENMLKEKKVIILDPQTLAAEKEKLQQHISELWKAELLKVAAERDVYGQFFFSLMDLVAKTPPLFDLVAGKLDHLTDILKAASLRPYKKPNEKSMLRSIFGGLTKLLLSSKNRSLLGVHMDKVEFKKPFFQMMETGNIPKELEALAPKVTALKAANADYQKVRKEWEEKNNIP